MTTAPPPRGPRSRPIPVRAGVRASLLVTTVLGVAAVAVAGMVSGRPGAIGAAAGVLMVCVFFGLGTFVVSAAATVAPSASLPIAMLTYLLQVMLLALAFLALSRSGALEEDVDRIWLGGTVIVGTLLWLCAHIVTTMRSRQLLYDLPSDREEADTR